VLGELTGTYVAQVTALSSECRWGPEVPFDGRSFGGTPFRPFSESYWGTLEQRGDQVVFEISEGLVFARLEADRLVDVVRVAGDGVTHYHDGLVVTPAAAGFLVSGETDWTFESGIPGSRRRARGGRPGRSRDDAPVGASRISSSCCAGP
jgi:hypothetical protein